MMILPEDTHVTPTNLQKTNWLLKAWRFKWKSYNHICALESDMCLLEALQKTLHLYKSRTSSLEFL